MFLSMCRRDKHPRVVRVDVEDRAVAPPPTGLPKSSHAQHQPDDTGKGPLPPRPPPAGTGQAEVEQAASQEHAAPTIRQPETLLEATTAASAEAAVAAKGLRREARLEAEPAAAWEPPPCLEGTSGQNQQAVAEAGHASASKRRPGQLQYSSPHGRRLEAEHGTAGRGEPQVGQRRRQAEGLHRLSCGRHGRHEHQHHQPPRWAVSGGWAGRAAACLAGSQVQGH